jgi:hypothetical protein
MQSKEWSWGRFFESEFLREERFHSLLKARQWDRERRLLWADEYDPIRELAQISWRSDYQP